MDTGQALNKIRKFIGNQEILILFGGSSSERNASIKTGNRVAKCLEELGLEYSLVDSEINPSLCIDKAKKAGLVFLALHGGMGENGTIQGALDFLKIPYTGSGILGSAVGMNKLVTKRILKASGIITSDFVVRNESDSTKNFINESEIFLGYPMMLKIWDEGSGNGVYYIDSRKEFESKLEGNKDINKVFVEKFIEGKEITVGLIEVNGEIQVLPIMEVIYDAQYFDKKIRRDLNNYRREVPAQLDGTMEKKVRDICTLAHKVLGAEAYSRIDIRIDEKNNTPVILEITTLPGLTESSWIPEMAEKGGISFCELVLLIITASIRKYDSRIK